MQGRVLVIAGSDSGGGAGIQADIKAIMACGGYAMTAITALTAQNTLGVSGVLPVPPEFVRLQVQTVLEDIGADLVKTGMLLNAGIIHAVADLLEEHPLPLVLDPVMVATSGAMLLEEEAVTALKERLLPRAALVTPNIPEAEVLSGRTIGSVKEMEAAAETILASGCEAVLLKGGHLESPSEMCQSNIKSGMVADLLLHRDGCRQWQSPRIPTVHTHGTGCTLASAVSAFMARGVEVEQAVEAARAYVQRAILNAPGLGLGHGPLNHAA